MYLLKSKYLYILLFVTVGVLLGFSIWGYFTLMNNGGYQSYEMKYFAECFIFSALLLITIVCSFFILILHKSINIYKDLDKIHELFDQGNYYTQNSFKKLGTLGIKILRINSHLITLNDIKSKKISSDSKIINFLLGQSIQELLIVKNNGIIKKGSKVFFEKNNISEDEIIDVSIDSIVEQFEFINIFTDLNNGQNIALKKRIYFKNNIENGVVKYLIFIPIFNIANDLSYTICTFVSEEKFNEFNQNLDNRGNTEESVYKNSLIMRKISELFNQD